VGECPTRIIGPLVRNRLTKAAFCPDLSCRLGETPMTTKTLADLLLEPLKDLYYADNHILKALPHGLRKEKVAPA
jgi:hypothetical protein